MHDSNDRGADPVRVAAVCVLAALAVVPAVVLAYATSYAIGVTPDGVIYFDAASRLARDGQLVAFQYGVVKPVTRFPPLFPALLAIAPATGTPILLFGRWLNVVLLWATVFGTGLTVLLASRNTVAAAVAIVLVGSGIDTIGVHALLLSEPLFLPLLVAALFALAVFAADGSRWALVVAGAATGLACLVRFPAVAVAGTGVVTLLLFRRDVPFTRRLRSAALFAVIAIGPFAAWLLTRSADSATDRHLAYHPLFQERLREALGTVRGWVIPGISLSPLVDLVLALLAASVLAWLTARVVKQGGRVRSLAIVGTVFVLCYGGLLILSVTFVDAQTHFDRRILLPLRIPLVVLFALGVAHLMTMSRWARRIAIAAALVVAAGSAAATLELAVRLHVSGAGYTAREWQEASLDRVVRQAGTDQLYSNGPEAIYFLTGAHAHEIPAPIDRWTRQRDPDYETRFQHMSDALADGRAAIVYFRGVRRPFVADVQALSRIRGVVATELDDAIVLLRASGERLGSAGSARRP